MSLGSLNSAYDSSFMMYKLKPEQHNILVESGEIKSFQYNFPAYTNLDTNEKFTLLVHAIYSVGDQMYSSTFCNETISFVDEASFIDGDAVFAAAVYIVGVAIILFVGFKAFQSIFGGSGSSSRSSSASKKHASSGGKKSAPAVVQTEVSADNEWVTDYIGKEQGSKKKKGKKD